MSKKAHQRELPLERVVDRRSGVRALEEPSPRASTPTDDASTASSSSSEASPAAVPAPRDGSRPRARARAPRAARAPEPRDERPRDERTRDAMRAARALAESDLDELALARDVGAVAARFGLELDEATELATYAARWREIQGARQ